MDPKNPQGKFRDYQVRTYSGTPGFVVPAGGSLNDNFRVRAGYDFECSIIAGVATAGNALKLKILINGQSINQQPVVFNNIAGGQYRENLYFRRPIRIPAEALVELQYQDSSGFANNADLDFIGDEYPISQR